MIRTFIRLFLRDLVIYLLGVSAGLVWWLATLT